MDGRCREAPPAPLYCLPVVNLILGVRRGLSIGLSLLGYLYQDIHTLGLLHVLTKHALFSAASS